MKWSAVLLIWDIIKENVLLMYGIYSLAYVDHRILQPLTFRVQGLHVVSTCNILTYERGIRDHLQTLQNCLQL